MKLHNGPASRLSSSAVPSLGRLERVENRQAQDGGAAGGRKVNGKGFACSEVGSRRPAFILEGQVTPDVKQASHASRPNYCPAHACWSGQRAYQPWRRHFQRLAGY